MSVYICEKCGCLDNTSCGGNYWVRNINPEEDQIALCCECYKGTWHNQFEKAHWTKYGVQKIVELESAGNGSMVNGVQYLKSIGELPQDFVIKMRPKETQDCEQSDGSALIVRDTRKNRRGKIKAGKRKY